MQMRNITIPSLSGTFSGIWQPNWKRSGGDCYRLGQLPPGGWCTGGIFLHPTSSCEDYESAFITSAMPSEVGRGIIVANSRNGQLQSSCTSHLVLRRSKCTTFSATPVADGGRRFLMMRFGASEVDMSNRWRGHEKASKLETAQGRKSRFYTRYPHKDFLLNDPSRLRECLFQDLQQFVGIGFKRDNKEHIGNLFDWDNGEVKELEKLTAASESRNTLVDKKISLCCLSQRAALCGVN
jgi:hypothetical protein